MSEKYGKDVEFIFVYVKEAHPEGEGGDRGSDRGGRRSRRPGSSGVGGNGAAKQPTTLAERLANAKLALDGLKLDLTTVLDDMKDSVGTAYSGHPDRLFIVDKKGKIAYSGDRGPRGYDIDGMAKSLGELLKTGGVLKEVKKDVSQDGGDL